MNYDRDSILKEANSSYDLKESINLIFSLLKNNYSSMQSEPIVDPIEEITILKDKTVMNKQFSEFKLIHQIINELFIHKSEKSK